MSNKYNLEENQQNTKWSFSLGQIMFIPLIMLLIIFVISDYVKLRNQVQQLEIKIIELEKKTKQSSLQIITPGYLIPQFNINLINNSTFKFNRLSSPVGCVREA